MPADYISLSSMIKNILFFV